MHGADEVVVAREGRVPYALYFGYANLLQAHDVGVGVLDRTDDARHPIAQERERNSWVVPAALVAAHVPPRLRKYVERHHADRSTHR